MRADEIADGFARAAVELKRQMPSMEELAKNFAAGCECMRKNLPTSEGIAKNMTSANAAMPTTTDLVRNIKRVSKLLNR